PQTTTGEGNFAFPSSVDPQAVYLVLHDSGYAMASHQDLLKSKNVKLTAWTRVEVVVFADGKPAAGEKVGLWSQQPSNDNSGRLSFGYDGITDENGKFVFDRVMKGSASVARARENPPGLNQPYGPYKPVLLNPGETVHVEFGRNGPRMIGKLLPPKDRADLNIDFTSGQIMVRLLPIPAGAKLP